MKDFLSQRIHRIDTSEIRKAFDLAVKIKNPVNLSIGQPDFPVPEAVKESFMAAVKDNKNAYTQTQGILPLREGISEYLSKSEILVSPNHILISTGVASILFLLFETLFNEGDEIILIDPYFLVYESLAQKYKLKVFYLSENFSEADVKNLLHKEKLEKLKAIIFATPSNPTGKILTRNQLQLLSTIAEKKDALLISDEIYEAFDYDHQFIHTASVLPERTLTLGGFSKSHAMTGWRVGYICAPARLSKIIEKMATLQQYSIVCAPQPAQWAAVTALKTPITKELEMMKQRRELVKQLLGKNIQYSDGDGAFYFFLKTPIDGQTFTEAAAERALLVVPGHIFSNNRNYIRISYAQKEEVLKLGIDIIQSLYEKFNV